MLRHVGLLLGLSVLLALLLSAGVWFTLGRPDLGAPLPAPAASATAGPTPTVTTATRTRALTATERLDSPKVILAVIAGVGGIVALAVAYRKQRYGEAAENRERTRLFGERSVQAVEQLGHDHPAVRVAGVYAMAAPADEWLDGRQCCIDVLCAYLRMPYDPDGETAAEGEREVRRTLFRVTDVTFAGDPVEFDGADFSGATDPSGVFTAGGVWFDGSRFVGGTTSFEGVTTQAQTTVSFLGARHTGGTVRWGPFQPLPAPAPDRRGPLRRAIAALWPPTP
jgi:hypothetical protein